jgi:hypothetical protein
MNSHKNARLTFEGRKLLIDRIAAMGCIATVLGRSLACISRFLATRGLSSLRALEPRPPLRRYERAAPGELLHMDTNKLGRIEAVGHRVTGNPRDRTRGAGWEVAHVAIDDHSRVGFVQMHPGLRLPSYR